MNRVEKQSQEDLSVPISRERRKLLSGIAASCAAIASTAIGLPSASAVSEAAPQVGQQESQVSCERRKVVASDRVTVVETSAGKVRGFERSGVFIFKGIPYGASTSGANRFMPPMKPESWAGIRNALAYGRICPQEDSAHSNTDGKNLANADEDAFLLHRGYAIRVPGEDCLRVNVWTPEINGSGKRPVMVYMHGGGFSGGCGHDLLSYEGESLARNHDVVLVNHNHRLNVYGYLNLEGLFGDEFASSANVGMLDLVAVFEWVRTHISMFGGDPNNVTIFGQSGGGGKVAALLAMPAAKGLFHRAIIQSGPFVRALSQDYSHRVAETLLAELGLQKSEVRKLQKIPVDQLSGVAAEAIRKTPQPLSVYRDSFGESGWGPTVDGHSLPIHPFDPGAPAISADVPLITGTNLNESVSGLDHPGANAMTAQDMKRRIHKIYGSDADAIIAAYKDDYPNAAPFGLYATIATAKWRIPAFKQASRKAALGVAPAYSYIYSWRTPVLDNRPGTFHACEISFAFDNAEICDHYSAGDSAAFVLSKQMSAAWVSFARTGNPNHSGLPPWPRYTQESRAVMYFDTPCAPRNNPEGKGLDIIVRSQPS